MSRPSRAMSCPVGIARRGSQSTVLHRDVLARFCRLPRRHAKAHAIMLVVTGLILSMQERLPALALNFLCQGLIARAAPATAWPGTAAPQEPHTRLQAIALADLLSGEEYQGKVSEVFGDGVMVDIDAEVPGFVARSALAEPLEAMEIGQQVNARIIRVREEPKNRRSSGIFRQRLELSLRKDKRPLTGFEIGHGASGVVEYVARWGAFVDIGSDIAGMLPKAEMQDKSLHGRLKVGSNLDVWVRKLGSQDGRAQLTTRNLEAGLPENVLDISKLPVGTVCTGTVMRVKDFGAFIDVGTKKWAFSPIREINDGMIESVESVLRVGDLVSVEVTRNTGEQLNVRLDIPEHSQDLSAFRSLPPSKAVEGKVVRKAGDKWLVLAVTTGDSKACS
mmetsp:Transcript_12432/g.28176  ORF Transcript_12432/g.28176 Transcript_12432/m.28176 type:complete len:391 (+) Transcript_12432:39-1211(+)